MDYLHAFTLDQTSLFIAVGILGLVVGSFLNVVIYRLPIMMMRENYDYCLETFACKANKEQSFPSLNLAYPASHCPSCKHVLRFWENIPVLSFIWQKGRCTQCKTRISIRYPLVEISSAILALTVAWHFGATVALLPAILLVWALLVLGLIDWDHQLLPDNITLPFLWLGLLCNLWGFYTDLQSSVIGAMIGYMSLWGVYWGFKLLRGKEGMGYGDFKLFALLGAWLGWQSLPIILLLASVAGTIVGISLVLFRQHDKNIPISFGPYLATAGYLTLLWGEQLQTYVFRF